MRILITVIALSLMFTSTVLAKSNDAPSNDLCKAIGGTLTDLGGGVTKCCIKLGCQTCIKDKGKELCNWADAPGLGALSKTPAAKKNKQILITPKTQDLAPIKVNPNILPPGLRQSKPSIKN